MVQSDFQHHWSICSALWLPHRSANFCVCVCVSLATLLTALLFAPFRRHLVGSQAKSKKKTMSCDQPLFTKTSRGPVSLVECHFILKNVWSFGFSKRHCRDGETDRRPNQSFFMFSFSMPPHCFLDGPVSVATPSRSGEKKQKRFCCSTSVPLSLWPHTHTHTHPQDMYVVRRF